MNAYYRENFYGQLEFQPVNSPSLGSKGYVEIELEGSPSDYPVGWLIGMETEDYHSVDPNTLQKLILDIVAKVVQKHPDIDFQDKFMLVVLDAYGREYGRGAMGALPSGELYDLFIGETSEGELVNFSDERYFRIIGDSKVVGLVMKTGYTFDDYQNDRKERVEDDQFIRGMAIFDKAAPLSCASHDILHGLRRKSAKADPPEGRDRAVNCLYNLQLQSQWLIGTERGSFDRNITCSPYIGWWDPMSDHLHPRLPRPFFDGHPHGMSAFTKLRMGMIPDRCLFVADRDNLTIKLAPLSQTALPQRGSEAETMVVKVPVIPDNEKAAHVYLLLEYRMRYGSGPDDFHPDNFYIDPEYVMGEASTDPGYNNTHPEESEYINPPTTFVPDEGVLVYLVNEKMPENPGMEYQGWNMFILALLNPEGNEKRDNLNQAALDSGEEMIVDFRTLYSHADLPIKIKIAVQERGGDYAKVRIEREYLLEHSLSVMADPSTLRSEEASTIIVRVKEGSSYLSGAAVNLTSEKGGSISPANGVTDVNGEFTATFVAPSVMEETSFVIKAGVKKNGYLLGRAETEVNVTPICSLLITLLDESGTPIGDAAVISKSQPAGQSKLDGITFSNGSVTFLDVMKGSYSFQASKTGFIEETASLNAEISETNEMIITLTAEPSVSEDEPPRRKGIPGFPYESIIIGLVVGASVLLMLQRRRCFTPFFF